MDIYTDIEANGLQPTRIHCAGVMKQGSSQVTLVRDPAEFQAILDATPGANVYAHNGMAYDFLVLQDLWSIDFSKHTLRDSLVMSRLWDPSLPRGHSLEAWGDALGFPKGTYEGPWDEFTDDMGVYCLQDVRVLERLVAFLRPKLGDVIDSYALTMEQAVAPIIDSQIKRGWRLDERRCFDLLTDLRTRKELVEHEVHIRFKPAAKPGRTVAVRRTKDGSISRVGCSAFPAGSVAGDFTHVTFPEFNLGSRQQIGSYLQRFGWVPRKFTETGQPVVSEDELEAVDIPEAQLIAEYLTIEKRQAMINSWLDGQDEEGRVHGYVNPIGAVTGRMTHSSPNVAQVTAKGKPYGAEMRRCWTVSPGYSLVGMDADGLELRMLAHYMNDPEFTRSVCEGRKEDGTDVHTRNQLAAGLPTRDAAKTFIYAFLYGAGDEKIGSIIGAGRSAGKRIKARFLDGLPALKELKARVASAARRGWLRGLDGRRIIVRSEHAALNTLLQGGGAVVMKQALVLLDERARKRHIDFGFVGNIHDEIQSEVWTPQAQPFAAEAQESMVLAGEFFNLRCPLKGTATIGATWYDTH